jgi:uncharacterized protein YxeA
MEQWSTFLADRWYVLLIAFLVLVFVMKLVKTVVKWVLVLVIAAGVLYYGYNYTDNLDQLAKTVTTAVSDTVKEQAMKLMVEEAKDATYTDNGDKTFTITTKSIRVEGKRGADEVKVTFLKQTFTVKAEMIQTFIDEARKNG